MGNTLAKKNARAVSRSRNEGKKGVFEHFLSFRVPLQVISIIHTTMQFGIVHACREIVGLSILSGPIYYPIRVRFRSGRGFLLNHCSGKGATMGREIKTRCDPHFCIFICKLL